jgi:undecaprenyl diphosphate synthase
MEMLSIYLRKELDFLREQNVRLETIGRLERLPEKVQKDLAQAKALLDSNTGMSLCLAINYGGRAEIVDAVREISAKVAEGQLAVDAIDEQLVARHLQTRGMTDPDLLVRTAGEMRVSNFLLWQISYAELWVTEKTWPEFDVSDFDQALIDYAGRERRFGGLNQGGKQTC